jgi:hypothetical protein
MSDVILKFGLEGGPTLGDYNVSFKLPVAQAGDLLAFYGSIYFPNGVEVPAEEEGGEVTYREPTPAEIVNSIGSGMARGMADQVTSWKRSQASKVAVESTPGIEITPN